MTKATAALRDQANAPKNQLITPNCFRINEYYRLRLCVWMLVLVIRHATRISFVQYFIVAGSTIPVHIITHTARFSGGGGLLNIKGERGLALKIVPETFLIPRGLYRDYCHKVTQTGLHIKLHRPVCI
jgi:hypothetical protein